MHILTSHLRSHLWMVATGVTAATVFVITFVAVSAASGGSDEPELRVVADPEPIVEEEPQVIEPEPQPESSLPAAPDEPALALPAAPEVQRELPRFDEGELIYGGEGTAGAILAGQGIVPSSGLERRTDWLLLVPSARIKARIVKIGLSVTGALGSPDNPDVIGWWESGPRPGQRGNVLLDGHRDYEDVNDQIGTGVCWLLPNTTVGDFMIVRDEAEGVSHLYTVIEAASVPADSREGVQYLQPSRDPLLTLITCEGSFDSAAHNYSNRRIIVAELTDTLPTPEA